MKKIYTLLLLSFLFITAKSQTVVISQVYGGGNNSGAAYQNDFVELFNASSSPVDITGWSIQYANATNATGSWSVNTLPAFILNPGQYFLLQLAGGTTNGLALPTADGTGATNMGSTGGRVALVNNAIALAAGCPASSSSYVDLVGYGNGGTPTTCFEGSGPAASPSSTNSTSRKLNGCQDTQDNASDFTAGAASPRNSVSALNPCGPASPLIIASPNITGLTTSLGVASSAISYNLSAIALSPAADNITVTPSAGLEVSLSSGSGFTSLPLLVPYTAGIVTPAIKIYVRIAASTPQGAVAGTVTNSGGTASNVVITVAGAVVQDYYSKTTGNLEILGTWGTNPADGSGTAPTDFAANYQVFHVVNQANATIGANWDVPGTGSKLVVGDGTNAIMLTIPATFKIASTTSVDVLNNATLKIINNSRPSINNPLGTGSTVEFAQTGITTADTIRIPAITFYHLKLTGGLKFLNGNTTTVKGNLTVDGVASFNGNGVSPFSTINAFGNVTFLNGTAFEPYPAGDPGRITLAMNAAGTQTITGNTTNVYLYRLRRDTTTSSSNIVLGTPTNLFLGNLSTTGGGLQLNQGAATTTVLNIGANNLALVGSAVSTASSTGKINSTGGSIAITKVIGAANAGTLRFQTGTTLAQLGMNCLAFTRDSVTIADNVTITGLLTLTKGRIVMSPTATLNLATGCLVSGGADTSYVDGKVSGTSLGVLPVLFPVGRGNKYGPVSLIPVSSLDTFIVDYNKGGYGNYTIDPATAGALPGYYISGYEYWNVNHIGPNSSANTVTFNYTDASSLVNLPLALRMAHFDGTDWNDLPTAVPAPTNTTTKGSVTVPNITTFSPFTFAANGAGVIPVKVEYIKGQKTTRGNLLNWKVNCLSTNIVMELQRAADTRNFNSITSIAATQARCNQPFDYTDAQPLAGSNFYRLKMIDVDGRISYSPTVAIMNGGKGVEFVGLYPSTVQNETSLSVSAAKATTVETLITDMSGKVIKTSKQNIAEGSTLINIDCSHLANGVYNITGIAGDGSSKTIRFIKL